jgi:hypothetical protein
VKRAKIIVAALIGAVVLLVAGIIGASIPGASAAKPTPAPSGPHWVTQQNSVEIPAGSTTPPTYTIGCAAGEVMLGSQSSGTAHYGNGTTDGPYFSLDGLASPLGYTAAQRQATVPTSSISYTVYADPNGPNYDVTVTWTVAVLCEAAG